jgi:phenylalanyl-tRNA synthetase beta chain
LDDVGIEVKRVETVGTDTHYSLELLANRGDHYCYEGVARELSGRTGHPINPMARTPLEIGDSPIALSSETPDCLVYTATLMERDGEASTFPPELLKALTAAGI